MSDMNPNTPPPQGYAPPTQPVPTMPVPQQTKAAMPGPVSGKKSIREKRAPSIPGLLGLLLLLALWAFGIYEIYLGFEPLYSVDGERLGIGVLCIAIALIFQTSFTIIQPGETKVLQFLGSYVGTVRATGLRMTLPLTTKRRVSVRVRNFETREIKVNDSQGNPVVIGAIIVWQVQDTAQSTFQVEHYENFVHVQAEAALRHIATIHPYDNGESGEATLRGATDQVAAELAQEVGERVSIAGVRILETRISSLSYAPEIASAMLQRQQAQAVLAARAKIVEGAVTMVQSALARIDSDGIVEMDDDRKAAMVANLLVVLCSDSRAMPTVNTGS
ncbi:MAG: SPFH domain-containing protein [Propionibacteriaceae bacterium]|jgi:hypothetical protein|nr:SPFH domain-containing protein [Propionibacteriaceae bacterium]